MEKEEKSSLTKEEVIEKIKENVKKIYEAHGKTVDSDFDGDLDDVVSDLMEDEPDAVKGLDDPKKRKEVVAKVADELL